MTWYAIQPHDTFLIRDGRTFDTGSGAVFESVLPRPGTIGGAVAAAIGGDFQSLRGPFLGDCFTEKWTLYFSQPRDVVRNGWVRPDWTRIHPVRGSESLETSARIGGMLVEVDEEYRSTTWEYESALVSVDAIRRYLNNSEYPPEPDQGFSSLDDFAPSERRVGIAVEEGRVRDGFLYQATHRRLDEDVAFLADVETPQDIPTLSVPFGGAGRYAEIRRVEQVDFPEGPSSYPGGRLLLYVATPAIWSGGSMPPLPKEVTVVGAAIGPQEAIAAGASYRNGIKSTTLRWAVPAGSVYFLEFPSEAAALGWATRHSGKALGNDRFASTGFGVVLTGRWRYSK